MGVETPVAAASSDGRSCPAGVATNTASTVARRTTAVMPLSVANAATPSTTKTTTDFKLPPPMRTSVLLPQPDASTMPKPNIAPPTSADSHMKRAPPYRLLDASTQPSATMALKAIIATPMAMTHMRMRVQSPMLTMSATAPMVQKWVRWAMAPNRTESANAAHNTWVATAWRSMSCMAGFYAAVASAHRRRPSPAATSATRAALCQPARPRTSGRP